jgi:GNAT superfamily N-acetyltransferase
MCSPSVLVRLAHADDVEALDLLWEDLDRFHAELRPDYFRVPEARGPAAGCRQRSEDERFERVFVAEVSGEVVGAVRVKIYDTPEDPQMVPRRRALVDDLYVGPAHRARGVGRALMEAAAAWARSRRASEVVLTIWAGNDGAEAFYRQMGYRPVTQVLSMGL